jgi:hypothetical protein
MDLLQTYLESLNVIHSSGSAVKETSYYGTLENLLNEVSYRELELLGRPLIPDEAREVMNIARRLAACSHRACT